MAYLPLKLGVGRITGAKPVSQQSVYRGDDLKQLKLKIFERDDHTCQCCGFVSEKYQELLQKDMNPQNYQADNLATVCVFCHQVFHLEKVADMRSGVLVWLPEIGQAALHHIMRAVYVARVTQGPMADAARKLHDILMYRREAAKERMGTDDPAVLARIFQDFLEDREYHVRDKKVDGLRLMPLDRRIIKEGDLDFNQFPQILAYWRSQKGPFGDVMPSKWQAMLEEASSNLSKKSA